ncbi:uncharacterized protein LOC141661062 [Apium graveolens]|uniref:uncharacterized protein LOC141661054 n=1 Tax=Apium graveolens TaxID=4045 RepID=UPI003D7BD723
MAKFYALNLLPFLTILILLSSISATISYESSDQQIDKVIESLRCNSNYETFSCDGNFKIWIKLLEQSKGRLNIPVNATMFAPNDAALSQLGYISPHLIPYHISPSLHDLYDLKPLSLLPTLVPWKTILITSTLPSRIKIDNAIITRPYIYLSRQLVVHGINHILDLHPQRSSMPPLLRAHNVFEGGSSPAPAPARAPASA